MSALFFWASVLALVLGAAVTLSRKKSSANAGFALAAVGGLLAVVAGVSGIYGGGFRVAFDLGYGLGEAGFRMDGLAAFFVLVTGVVLVPTSIYATSYEVRGLRWAFAALYNLLMAATLLVFAAGNAFLFLLFWELAAILFYGLVSFEDRREGRVSAGYLYSAASKLGTALILAAFLLAFAESGSFDFGAMAKADLSGAYASAAFLLAFVGFGLKAGMVPVQVWLPDAHSKSPKPVSALLAGVLLNLGFYGIVLFDMRVLGAGPEWWGILVLLVGGVSAAVGILYAIAQRDLSRFVAYSSVENAGIVLIGIGVAMIGWSEGGGPLAGLGPRR